jgi:hypothetical protein
MGRARRGRAVFPWDSRNVAAAPRESTRAATARARHAPLVARMAAAGAAIVAVPVRVFLVCRPQMTETPSLRLLDHIAQSTAPFEVGREDGTVWRLTGASDFAARMQRCPLRFVLCDDLVRTCIALAYSEGDELAGCLDLLHVPAQELWVEWDEAARRAELSQVLGQVVPAGEPEVLRAGTLISARADCRAGTLRTFWLIRGEPAEALLSSVETLLDFDGAGAAAADPEALLKGRPVVMRDPQNTQLDSLLQCARFRLDGCWQRYYQAAARDAATQRQVIERSLGGVAFDVPVLLALFLLMAIRADLAQHTVDPWRLNAKRIRLGKRPLLEHIEVSSPVFAQAPHWHANGSGTLRRGPRLHHVRGHIVRRRNAVYWRGPHWRGHVRLGRVRTRTVELQLPG